MRVLSRMTTTCTSTRTHTLSRMTTRIQKRAHAGRGRSGSVERTERGQGLVLTLIFCNEGVFYWTRSAVMVNSGSRAMFPSAS